MTEVYIGEAEDFASRVKAHEKDKDWWEVFVVFGSKDMNLTKAHIRFLERWFYDRSSEALGRIRLMNDSTPPGAKLPEADVADMQDYGENALFLLGALGYRLFERDERVVQRSRPGAGAKGGTGHFEIVITRQHVWPDGSQAVGRLRVDAGGYVLLAGSAVRVVRRIAFRPSRHPTGISGNRSLRTERPWSG